MMQPSFDFSDPTAAIRQDCAKAVDTLKRMTSEEKGGTATKQGNDILPLDYLKRCKVSPVRRQQRIKALKKVAVAHQMFTCSLLGITKHLLP